MYVVSDELTVGPPTTTSHSAPATRDSLRPLATPGGASAAEHVERYVAGGGSAVTVSVRQHHHHQQQQQHRHRRHHRDDGTVTRQTSNYDDVLDEYLHAAIATQHANISSRSGKVQTLSTCD